MFVKAWSNKPWYYQQYRKNADINYMNLQMFRTYHMSHSRARIVHLIKRHKGLQSTTSMLVMSSGVTWYARTCSDLVFISVINGWVISGEIARWWLSLDLTDHKSTQIQVIVLCQQATIYFHSKGLSRYMSSYGHNMIIPQLQELIGISM